MITEEYYSRLEALRPEIENIKAALNLPAAERELTEIHEKTAAPDFWNDAAAGRTAHRHHRRNDRMPHPRGGGADCPKSGCAAI